jgi:hypothetical protein
MRCCVRNRFFNETAGLLSEAVDLTAARKWLDELVTILVERALDQDVGDRGARSGTAKQHQLRMKLRREQMEPIAVIARLTLRATPQFNAFRMPKPAVRGWVFVAHARVMAEAAGDNVSLLRAWESARPIGRKPVSEATSTDA